MFKTILVANRGEVAVRVFRAARDLGCRVVAVHSEADKGALWTRLADESRCLGPSPARQSYLDVAAVIAAAKDGKAEAIHPGYGLLSESAELAAAARDAGIAFIGPPVETLALMGDKVAARRAALACGVPILLGSPDPVPDVHQAQALAAEIGWPIAVKASFGGGGRGLRVAADSEGLAAAFEQAGREAQAAFGRAEVFLERYLVRPRHVEVQVLGDRHGRIVHLGDRDCSVQRRHQKLMEEAPAPGLSNGLRAEIADAALTLCRSVGYEGAGTVEFLIDPADQAFFFLEMNPRLQVEHGVSELVTGIDLVRQQILVAAGAALDFAQEDVRLSGHAIQARIAAEDPWEDFRPVPGLIERLSLPLGPWLRFDFGFEAGDSVPRYYDSLIGKVQAWGRDRDEARRRLAAALDAFVLDGFPTTAPYLRTLLDRPEFAEAGHDTGSLERDWSPKLLDRPQAPAALAPPVPLSRVRERRVEIPWGGRMVEVAIFGTATGAGPSRAAAARIAKRGTTAAIGDPVVVAPMDGVVIALAAQLGQSVCKGAPLLMLEAMKMEVVMSAPHDGMVEAIFVAPGDIVQTGAKLASVTPRSGSA